MRRHKPVRSLLLALSLTLASLILVPSSARAQPLDEVMARLAQVPSRRATFVEEKHLAALSQVLRSSGRLSYTRPAHLEKITEAPQQESLVVDGNRLIITSGQQDTPHVVALDRHPEAGAIVNTIRDALSGSLAALQDSYSIDFTGTPDNWRMVLRPRAMVLAQQVQEVHIAGGADVRSIEMIQPNGDTDTLTITPVS